MKLPSHIPVVIRIDDIERIERIFSSLGYQDTLFQIRKPRQSFGLVKEVEYNGQIVDHHVRAYQKGYITTEVELPRLKEMWLHLTSHSISAHERVINILEENNIEYSIDKNLRDLYKAHGPTEFKRDYLEFFRWFFYGVCFWVPLAYIWKAGISLQSLFKKRPKGRFQPAKEAKFDKVSMTQAD